MHGALRRSWGPSDLLVSMMALSPPAFALFGYVGNTTVDKWNKMERPGVLLENGHFTHVTWAVSDVDKYRGAAGFGGGIDAGSGTAGAGGRGGATGGTVGTSDAGSGAAGQAGSGDAPNTTAKGGASSSGRSCASGGGEPGYAASLYLIGFVTVSLGSRRRR